MMRMPNLMKVPLTMLATLKMQMQTMRMLKQGTMLAMLRKTLKKLSAQKMTKSS